MPMAPHSYDNQAASQMRNILQQPEYHRISPVNPDPFLGTWPADQSVPDLNTSRLFPVILILQIHNILKPMLSSKLDEHSFSLHSLPEPQIYFENIVIFKQCCQKLSFAQMAPNTMLRQLRLITQGWKQILLLLPAICTHLSSSSSSSLLFLHHHHFTLSSFRNRPVNRKLRSTS